MIKSKNKYLMSKYLKITNKAKKRLSKYVLSSNLDKNV